MTRQALLGAEVDAVTIEGLHAVIEQTVAEGGKSIIANHNAHSVYLYHQDERMRMLYRRARCIHVDGMPLIMLGRLLGHALRREHRVTYVDWVRPLLAFAASSGFRVFYVGSAPGVAERAVAGLRQEIPGLQIATHHGYVGTRAGDADNEQVIAEIQHFAPDILMVGMGMPRQEHWILDNFARLNARAILTSGACMDYVAGVVPTAPRWMGRAGVEWLFRLWHEPARLWRRYLLEPWYLLFLLARYGRRPRPD
jgi:N-acetylglucosaminyldiphosphoundecaprenol N-acetyl-beta-D-mannosaminyltransferase